MEATKNQCPKCTGQMVKGFVLDRNHVFGGLAADRLPRWVDGEPERGVSGGWKIVGKKTYEINRADRCEHCGYIEFYTGQECEFV